MARPRKSEHLATLAAMDDLVCDDGVVHLDAVREARARLPRGRELAELTAVLAALGDPTRLRIVAALADRELCVGDLAAAVGLGESAVSHQLRVLRRLRLVRSRREGRHVYSTLDDAHVAELYHQTREHVAHRAAAQGVA